MKTNKNECQYGILAIYGNEFYGEDGRLTLLVEAVRLPKIEDFEENNYTRFRILNVLQNDNACFKVERGQYLNMNHNRETFLFKESEKEELTRMITDFDNLLRAEIEADWVIYTEDGEIRLKGRVAKNLDEVEQRVFETMPQYYAGCLMKKDFPGGDFLMTMTADSLIFTEKAETLTDALISIGRRKKWDISQIEKIFANINGILVEEKEM